MEDLADISHYLNELNKSAVFNLGLDLGIGYSRLTTDSTNFLQDMLYAWLQKVDQVQERGIPTWERLVKSLKRVGQNGIAMNIEQDKKKVDL